MYNKNNVNTVADTNLPSSVYISYPCHYFNGVEISLFCICIFIFYNSNYIIYNFIICITKVQPPYTDKMFRCDA